MVYTHQLAYRHDNGEVEGFKGSDITGDKAKAKADAIQQVRRKCEAIGQPFNPSRLIENEKGLTDAEIRIVRNDWKVEVRY